MTASVAMRIEAETAVPVSVDHIDPSVWNPRQVFEQGPLEELRDDILAHGLLQPIVVRPGAKLGRYDLVIGERRWRAFKLAGLEEIPAFVRNLSDAEVKVAQVSENDKRRDVTAIEEGIGYQHLREEGWSVEKIAERFKKSTRHVYGRLKLLNLAPEVREAYGRKALDTAIVLVLASLPAALQVPAAQEIAQHHGDSDEPWSFRDALDWLRREVLCSIEDEQWDPADATLLPEAGPCTVCPSLGSNLAEVPGRFANICTAPECLNKKRAEHLVRIRSNAKANGLRVIDGADAEALLLPWRDGGSNCFFGGKGWTTTHERHYNVEGNPTYGELLELANRRPDAVIVDEKFGWAHEVLKSDVLPELDKLFRKAGVTFREKTPTKPASGPRETPAQHEQQRAKHRAVMARVGAAIVDAVVNHDDVDGLALRFVLHELWMVNGQLAPLQRLVPDQRVAETNFLKTLEDLDERTLLGWLVEDALSMILADHLFHDEELPPPAINLLHALRIDPPALAREPEAAPAKKPDGKKPPENKSKAPAAKKAPAKKPDKKSPTKKGR